MYNLCKVCMKIRKKNYVINYEYVNIHVHHVKYILNNNIGINAIFQKIQNFEKLQPTNQMMIFPVL